MAPELAVIVEPPKMHRAKESSADPKIVLAMANLVKEGVWVSDNLAYETADDAGNSSQVYRKALAIAIGQPVHKIKSRVWGEDKDGTEVLDRTKKASWVYALTLNPNAQKRERKAKAA